MGSPRRLRIRREVSAGGVIVRPRGHGIETCLIVRRTDEGRILGLPKGHLEAREDLQAAAVREVQEETGLIGKPVAKLGAITYWFTPPRAPSHSKGARSMSSKKRVAASRHRNVGKGAGLTLKEERVRCFKTVHFYLLRYRGGTTIHHDAEVEEAIWLPMEDAIAQASFEGERRILHKANQAISDILFKSRQPPKKLSDSARRQ